VGTNVASDALANLASGGVTGGALIIVGEDYGEGSSIMQERSHAFAMKSQMWLLDPRPNLPHRAGGEGRLRAVRGQQHAGDAAAAHPRLPRARQFVARTTTRRPSRSSRRWKIRARRQPHRAAAGQLSCTSRKRSSSAGPPRCVHPGAPAQRILRRRRHDIGIIVQGGSYNTLLRALEPGPGRCLRRLACRCT
jgi:indolepyruvate ferredoxin oxidoreductase alpha subunit